MLPFLTFKIRADPSREEISPWHFWHSSVNLWELAVTPLPRWALWVRV